MDEIDDSELFLPAVRRRYQQDIVYSSRGYRELLGTYSGHRVLAPEQRQGILACVGDLIDDGYGGAVTKRCLYELRVAHLRDVP